MNSKIRNIFSPRVPVVSPTGEGRAQQQFKQDCDLNTIMRKFQKTGALEHQSRYSEEYGIVTSTTLHEALNTVTAAQSMFSELPSSLRKKFKNDPSKFLDFVQDDNNYSEAIELGLLKSDNRPPPAATTPVEATTPSEAGASDPGES